MTYVFLPDAQEEFQEAALRYEQREEGLGFRFRNEIEYVIKKLTTEPLLWRERPGGYRRVNCAIFPYHVAYFIRGQTIVIAAIAHNSRIPNYWRKRAS